MKIVICDINQELAEKLKLQYLNKEGVVIGLRGNKFEVEYDNEEFALKILNNILQNDKK